MKIIVEANDLMTYQNAEKHEFGYKIQSGETAILVRKNCNYYEIIIDEQYCDIVEPHKAHNT